MLKIMSLNSPGGRTGRGLLVVKYQEHKAVRKLSERQRCVHIKNYAG